MGQMRARIDRKNQKLLQKQALEYRRNRTAELNAILEDYFKCAAAKLKRKR
jgi:hypothetical protein